MRNLTKQDLETVLQLALLTEDKTEEEHGACLRLAAFLVGGRPELEYVEPTSSAGDSVHISYGDDDEPELILVTGLVRDAGSLVLLSGTDDSGRTVHFWCERQYGSAIADAIGEHGEAYANVPEYLIHQRFDTV